MNDENLDPFEKQRSRMVDQLVAPYGIQDGRVLAVMRRLPRHRFLDRSSYSEAYEDHALSIGSNQTISQPYMVARMTELAQLSPSDRVLEIGTGSGYQTAILASLTREVFSVERLPELADRAMSRLQELGFNNITIKVFDGTCGWSEHDPYDAVLVTAGAPRVPECLVEQLKRDGRLVIPVGDEKYQRLLRLLKREEGNRIEDHGGCVFVKLIGLNGWGLNPN